MEIIFIMLGVSLLLSFCFLFFFFWASKNKQFSDLSTPSWRMILDEQKPINKIKKGDIDGA